MDDNDFPDSLPWKEINELIQREDYKELIDKLGHEPFKFAAKDSNRQKVIESALRYLQKSDPENANYSRAVNLADIMQNFARKLVSN